MNDQVKDYRLQGIALMGTNNYLEAQNMFKKALDIEESLLLWEDLGNAYASNGEYKKAINAFTNALSFEPENGEILFNIGSAYLLEDRINKSIEFYNRAEKAGFDNVRLYINFAALYNALGDHQMELRNYTKAINKNPMMGELYVKKAMLLIDMEQYEAALEVLDDMLKIFPDAFEAYDLTARVYSAQGDSKKALEKINEGIKNYPDDINLKFSKIEILLNENKDDEAEEIIEELKNDPLKEILEREILMKEVEIASHRNEPEKMKSLLIKIVEKEDDYCDEQARFMLMMVSILLEDYELAYEQAEVLDKQESKSTFAISGMYYKGDILSKLGRDDEAREQFKKTTKELRKLSMTNRVSYEVYIFRALAHKGLKEYDKAMDLAEFIRDLQPDREDGYLILYDIYHEIGEEEKAEEEFQKALEINPELKRGK